MFSVSRHAVRGSFFVARMGSYMKMALEGPLSPESHFTAGDCDKPRPLSFGALATVS